MILPDKWRALEAINPQVRQAIRGLLACSSPRWPLFLHGAVGCGKTCAALAMCDRVPAAFYKAVRELQDELLQARDGKLWRDGHVSEGMVRVTEQAYWRRVDEAPLVVVDELGTRRAGDFELEVLKRLLDRREGRPTVCLSNHPLDGRGGLAELYDARVADRLRGGTVVAYPGGSRRGEGR